MSVPAVTRADVELFMHEVAGGQDDCRDSKTKRRRGLSSRCAAAKGLPRRTVGLLGSIFTYAVRHQMRPDNPVRGVERFADGQRKRRLTEDEYARSGRRCARRRDDGSIWPPAVTLTRFLLVTGWRRGEAIGLRASELDLARRTATLGDHKTGRSVRPLSTAAAQSAACERGTGRASPEPALSRLRAATA